MEYRVLGPLSVVDRARNIAIPAAKERVVLAALLAAPSRVVPVDRLIDDLWGEEPPRSAAKTLQTYVSHLRRSLGDRIVTRPPGYLITVEDGELDAATFEQLVADGRLALLRDDPSRAAQLLGAGLSLWRGAAFEDVSARGSVRAESVRLDELRLTATEDWFEARLAGGEHRQLTPELELQVARHPLRERLWSLLMQAQYRAGRQADALRTFQRARTHLVEELGVEPGPELRAVEAAVLGHRVGGITEGVRVPAARYVTNPDGLQIGYWSVGEGSDDLVFLGDIYMNLELLWEFPELTPVFDRLLPRHRLVSVQRRGTGLSDREPDGRLTPPQDCVDDVDAALGAVGSRGPVRLLGWGHGGQLAIAYAAKRPEMVSKLVVVNGYARLRAAEDYPGMSDDFLEAWVDVVGDKWGRNVSAAPIFGPAGDDPRLITRIARLERLITSPRDAITLHRALNDFDVRDLVPAVRCPALVVFLEESVSGRSGAKWLADHLTSARYVELPGHFMPSARESERLGETIAAFLRDGS